MPCESCNIQFTVFRRKRTCADCKRFYCSNCLTPKRSNSAALCERCTIFAKRPLLRADLQQLKPKDLIFYLQSKHISTTGCVEKDELVGLVLNHVQQADSGSNGTQTNTNNNTNYFRFETDTKNSFEGVKQSCQNFFINITDNITEKLNAYDGKSKTNRSSPTDQSSSSPSHIFDQPRVSTRQIPTYASYHSNHQTSSDSQVREYQHNEENRPSSSTASAPQMQNKRSRTTSPVVSTNSSAASQLPMLSPRSNERNSVHLPTADIVDTQQDNVSGSSDCDCSEDELYETFYGQTSTRVANNAQELLVNACSSTPSAGPSTGVIESHSSKLDIAYDIESSQSSFEELGAIGGISDDSKAATDTNSSNLEQWQILDVQRSEPNGITEEEEINGSYDNANENLDRVDKITEELPQTSLKATAANLNAPLANANQPVVPQRTKKVLRRRSESYLKQRYDEEDESPTTTTQQFPQISELQRIGSPRGNCSRCGKNKMNIKRHVEKMRRYLENVQMPEEDIINELKKFLAYMESRTKSVDCSDSETPLSPLSSIRPLDGSTGQATSSASAQQDGEVEVDDENDGIHVYAGSSEDIAQTSRFIKLEDYNTKEELESLNVKQLKEVLMLNRVDYKGCCEKQELLDRVQRLWNNLQSTPAVEKLQTDEMCKICMDAPIECVILECGHLATCINCGKILNECPICRQYIVRVVRFFRA